SRTPGIGCDSARVSRSPPGMDDEVGRCAGRARRNGQEQHPVHLAPGLRDVGMKQVIQTSGVMLYEPFGFTNCVRFKDVLYLSGIAALDAQGQVGGDDIETQTEQTFRNIQTV